MKKLLLVLLCLGLVGCASLHGKVSKLPPNATSEQVVKSLGAPQKTEYLSSQISRYVYKSFWNYDEYWIYLKDDKVVWKRLNDSIYDELEDAYQLGVITYEEMARLWEERRQRALSMAPIFLQHQQMAQQNSYNQQMLDLERQRLQIQRQQANTYQNSSFNTNCRYTSNNQVECQSSPSSTIIDLR